MTPAKCLSEVNGVARVTHSGRSGGGRGRVMTQRPRPHSLLFQTPDVAGNGDGDMTKQRHGRCYSFTSFLPLSLALNLPQQNFVIKGS